ncbi:MAG: GNAT family N-acetyltransferase, partial [Aestuariivirgaceae bacterium]
MRFSICIRTYKENDAEQLITLIRELQAHELTIFDRMKPPSDIGAWYVENLLRQVEEHSGQILVAERASRLIGYAAVMTSMTQDDPEEIAYSYAYVADIAVTKDHRGTGLGKRLLTECEKLALNRGAKWLRINALAGNIRAVEFYRQFGFS